MSSDFYELLIQRDVNAIPAAARAFASADELYLAVARFAVLAYAPSMHSKRAVMACRAAYELRDVCGDRWTDLIIECARYTAESRQPWSEPPIIEEISDVPAREELERAAGDDALLMIDTAFALIPILGEKGKSALLRMPQMELEAGPQTRSPVEPIETLVDQAIFSNGAIEDVTRVLLGVNAGSDPAPPPIYHLARDYAQTLLAHARPPAYRRDEFLAAVKHNLEHGEDFSDWSFA